MANERRTPVENKPEHTEVKYFSITEKGRVRLLGYEMKRQQRWSIVLSVAVFALVLYSLAIALI